MGDESGPVSSRVLLLGPLAIERQGRRTSVTGAQQAVLLAVLASRVGYVVPTDVLVDAAWDGRPPSTSAAALRVHLAKLRALLGGEGSTNPLRSIGSGYLLQESLVDTDVLAASRFAARARASGGDPVTAARAIADALELWRGDPFLGLRDVEWVRGEAERLRELRLDLQEELAALQLDQARHVELCSELSTLVREQPLREVRTRHLMLALYRSGRQADALAAYGELRDALLEELGVDPSPETRQLELAILRQEPDLSPTAAAPAGGMLVDTGPRGALDRPRSVPMLRDLVRLRMESLDEAQARLLQVVAVLGGSATLEVVAHVVDRVTDDVMDMVRRGHATGLLADVEDGVATGGAPIRFSREALREEVLVGLTDTDRAALHVRCAASLEAALPGPSGTVSAAWHRIAQAALRPVDLEEAGHAVVRALDVARSAQRHDAVDVLAESALHEVEWPAPIEMDVITRAVFARQALGRSSEATELWERGLALARQTADAERLALLVLAHDWTQRSMLAPEDARPLLAEALTLLGPQPSALRVAVASAYLVESVTPGRSAELGGLLAEVQEHAQALDDDASLRVADYTQHVLLRGSPDLEARQEVARRLWAAVDVPSPPALWRAEALLAMVFDACTAGDVDLADSLVVGLGASAEESGSVRLRWQHAITLAALSRERGDFERSDELAEEAMLLGALGGIPDAPGADALHRLQVLFHVGSLEPLLPTIEAFAQAQPDNPLVLGARALALAQNSAQTAAQTGAQTGAQASDLRTALGAAIGRLHQLGTNDEVALLVAAMVVEADFLVRELAPEERRWLQELLDPFAGQFVTFGQVSATWGPVDRLRALLASLDGGGDRGLELMTQARARTRSALWRDRLTADLSRLAGMARE